MKFEYDEIQARDIRMETEYSFGGTTTCSLIELLNEMGFFGWELVGEIHGKIVVKKLIT